MKPVMQKARFRTAGITVLALGAIVVAGCSSQQLNRTLYDTLGNIGNQQCSKETLTNCQQRQDYETYSRERR